MTIQLNNQQSDCVEKIVEWLMEDAEFKKTFCVNGYAGTGKTTILSYVTNLIRNNPDLSSIYSNIAFLTFTGKASVVLKEKLQEFCVWTKGLDHIGTIHSFLYRPVFGVDDEGNKKIIGWEKVHHSKINHDLIIIDESSMVSSEIYEDLLSLNIPILTFGDSFQLPPVSENKEKPIEDYDFNLTEIHRQSLDNPIIYLSNFVRENYYIPYGIFSESVFKLSWRDDKTRDLFSNINFRTWNIDDLIVLCGYNKTRVALNKKIRQSIGADKGDNEFLIIPGERVMCLLNDNVVSNGQIGMVIWAFYKKAYRMWKLDIQFNDFVYQTYCKEKFFNNLDKSIDSYEEVKNLKKKHKKLKGINCYDFAYAATTHKAQGSEFDKVILFEERLPKFSDVEYARWLYTAITRAKNKLFVIGK